LVKFVGRIKRAKDFVDGMEQDTASNTAPPGITLDQIAKIINVDIGVTQGSA
jgi:hypothetical protein